MSDSTQHSAFSTLVSKVRKKNRASPRHAASDPSRDWRIDLDPGWA